MAQGIKETKEALAFVVTLVEIVAPELKDGFQGKDLEAIVSKLALPENIAKLEAAVQGANLIGVEAQDIGVGEGFELLALLLGALKKLGV